MWRNRPAGCGAGCGAGCFGLDAGSRLRPHGPSHQSERLVVALSGRRTCEIRVRHSVMLSARSVCQPVASSGTPMRQHSSGVIEKGSSIGLEHEGQGHPAYP